MNLSSNVFTNFNLSVDKLFFEKIDPLGWDVVMLGQNTYNYTNTTIHTGNGEIIKIIDSQKANNCRSVLQQ